MKIRICQTHSQLEHIQKFQPSHKKVSEVSEPVIGASGQNKQSIVECCEAEWAV